MRRVIAVVLPAVLILGAAMAALAALSVNAPERSETITPFYTLHSPIVITGDAGFTAANGVTGGAGTPSNPYTISGWTISAATQAGIVIEQTTAHFKITNVNVHDGNITNAGIELNHVGNAKVSESVLVNNTIGIVVFQSNATVIENNTARLNVGVGIQVSNSTGVIIARNTLVNNLIGLDVSNSTRIRVSDNAAAKSIIGMSLLNDDNCTVDENSLLNNTFGLVLQMTNDTTLSRNLIVKSQSAGIFLFAQCINNTVTANAVRNTTGFGMLIDVSSDKNTMFNNNFHNGTVVPQALDNNETNEWNKTYPTGGNFWSDYTGIDKMSGPGQDIPGADGIGDTPYLLSGTGLAMDHYPLMAPKSLSLPPIALFTFTENVSVSLRMDFDASLSYDPDNEPLEYSWDSTNSGTFTAWSTSSNASFTYPQPGDYIVILQVKDPSGHVSSQTLTVSVGTTVIPEFATILVPVVAGIAIIFAFGRLRRKA